jgi:hypothetical protein
MEPILDKNNNNKNQADSALLHGNSQDRSESLKAGMAEKKCHIKNFGV